MKQIWWLLYPAWAPRVDVDISRNIGETQIKAAPYIMVPIVLESISLF